MASGLVTPKFRKALSANPSLSVATFAAGCFWGVEHIFRKHFAGHGLIDTEVGFSGGLTQNPTYRAVCGSNTQHAEALQILFDPKQLSYETLVDFFFRIHDPTSLNRQGADVGTQYRSAIFAHDPAQLATAEKVRDHFAKTFWTKHPIVTEIIPIKNWWDAEDYHQRYLDVNPEGYQCSTHYVRTQPNS